MSREDGRAARDLSTQTIPALECDVCDACGSRVRFITVTSYDLRPPRPGWKVAYLRCPVCGHHATRFEEISAHKSAPKSVRYVYRHG